MHVNTIQNSSQTYTIEELQQAVAEGKIDQTKITDVSVFNKSKDSEACKDGKDDGKIGFWEGLKETVKGAVKGVVNGIKGCFTDENGKFSLGKTLKTALTVGACFIPGVGPVIAGGLCAYGAVKGVSGIAKGVSAAANATTDAEKRAAFQSIGANGVVTAASVAGLRGSVGAIAKNAGVSSITAGAGKGIIGTAKNVATNVAKGATNYYGTAWSSATGTTAQKIAQVAKGTAVDTAGNVINAAKAAGSTIKNSKVGQAAGKVGGKIAHGKIAKGVGNVGGKVAGGVKHVGGKIANSGVGQKVAGGLHNVGGKIAGSKVGQFAGNVKAGVVDFAHQANAASANLTGVGASPLYGGMAVAAHQVGNAADDMTNDIYNASQTYATVSSQSGVEYDLLDYNIMNQDMLDYKYANIMQNARII